MGIDKAGGRRSSAFIVRLELLRPLSQQLEKPEFVGRTDHCPCPIDVNDLHGDSFFVLQDFVVIDAGCC
jgi:hypothetical protein